MKNILDTYERRVLEDIAKGRWNTGNRYLDTKDHLTANEYAQAALRGVRPYEERRGAVADRPATEQAA